MPSRSTGRRAAVRRTRELATPRRSLRAALLVLVLVVAAPLATAANGTAPVADARATARHAIRRPEAGASRLSLGRGSSSRRLGGAESMVGLTLLLAVVGGAAWAFRRWGGRIERGPGPVRVVARTPLTPRHAIHLVQAGERWLLVGTGTTGAPSLLGELGPDELSGLVPDVPAASLLRRGGGPA